MLNPPDRVLCDPSNAMPAQSDRSRCSALTRHQRPDEDSKRGRNSYVFANPSNAFSRASNAGISRNGIMFGPSLGA